MTNVQEHIDHQAYAALCSALRFHETLSPQLRDKVTAGEIVENAEQFLAFLRSAVSKDSPEQQSK